MLDAYEIKDTIHPLTGDMKWEIRNITSNAKIASLMKIFIEESEKEYDNKNYTLSIYDVNTNMGKTIEIVCEINEMPEVVEHYFKMCKAPYITFIGVNSFTKSYVVGMILSNETTFGCYHYNNGIFKAVYEY